MRTRLLVQAARLPSLAEVPCSISATTRQHHPTTLGPDSSTAPRHPSAASETDLVNRSPPGDVPPGMSCRVFAHRRAVQRSTTVEKPGPSERKPRRTESRGRSRCSALWEQLPFESYGLLHFGQPWKRFFNSAPSAHCLPARAASFSGHPRAVSRSAQEKRLPTTPGALHSRRLPGQGTEFATTPAFQEASACPPLADPHHPPCRTYNKAHIS